MLICIAAVASIVVFRLFFAAHPQEIVFNDEEREAMDYVLTLAMNALDYREYTPEKRIAYSGGLLSIIDENNGIHLKSGITINKGSSLLVYAYSGYMSAYDEANKCDEAKQYYEKAVETANSDYTIVSPPWKYAFFPGKDRKKYEEIKKRDLSFIAIQIRPVFNCVTDADMERVFEGEWRGYNENPYSQDDFEYWEHKEYKE